MSRADKQAARSAEEQAWRQAGEQAFYAGVAYTDWPRPEKKYSTVWYRTQASWQQGWMAASGLQPLMSLGSIPAVIGFKEVELNKSEEDDNEE